MDILITSSNGQDFFSYLSKVYGTGNVFFDLTVVVCGFCLTLSILYLMKYFSLGRGSSQREAEYLEEISQLLHEMHLQVNELRSSVVNELSRYRSELGAIRQEIRDLQNLRNLQKRLRANNNYSTDTSLQDFFTVR